MNELNITNNESSDFFFSRKSIFPGKSGVLKSQSSFPTQKSKVYTKSRQFGFS